MEELIINGYLTQSKLFDVLRRIFGEENVIGEEIPAIPGTRTRFDMAFRKDSTIIIVEMDGDEHYRNSLKIRGDKAKDDWTLAQGYILVRIPYWIQLDSETFQYFFGFESGFEITTNFNHGFITTRILPASFCEMGVQRFDCEFEKLPVNVKTAVLESLSNKSNQFGTEYVLPRSLMYLLNTN